MRVRNIFLIVLFSFSINCVFAQEKEINYSSDIEGTLKDNGRMIVVFSSANSENIVFNSTISSRGSKQKYSLTLQYSLDNKKWNDVKDKRGRRIEFVTNRKARTQSYKVELPSECEDKDTVWVSWKSQRHKGKGRYPELNIRKISITAEFDRFLGKKPELSVSLRTKDNTNKKVDSLIYNHTPLPYTYPQTKRIVVRGKYIRDGIKLSVTGRDAKYFKINNEEIKIDSAGFEIISVSYFPFSEGSHTATLNISTKKLDNPITLKLFGSSAKVTEVNYNYIDDKPLLITDKTTYRIPVFSEMDYQFKLSYDKNRIGDNNISVTYKWYRDNQLLYEMKDKLKNETDATNTKDDILYCVPLTSPQYSNSLQIEFSTESNLKINELYFGTPFLKRTVASGKWSDENIWSPKEVPVMEDFVYISPKHKIQVDDDAVCSMLVMGDSSNISIDANKMFYISGDIVYGKGSWFIVHQDLLPKKWNYISSPINNAKAMIFSMRKDDNETWLMKYNTGQKSKLNDYWSEYIVDPNFWLVPGQGYAVFSNKPLDVIYEGILCDSRVNYTLEYSEKDKWNLVGNPFTAPLSSKKIFEDIDQKIQGNALFFLDSENGVYNPIIIDGKEEVVLPSMQGFFVESLRENTELSFQRNHQYIPKSASYHWSNHNYLTLTISKGNKSQYILMGMDDNAKYGFDNYDAHKLFGSSEEMPEIYFKVEGEELAVNVFPTYPAIFDLGYYLPKEADLSLIIGNLSILPQGILLLLQDTKINKFYNLCIESQVDFGALKGTTEDRFRLHIMKSLELETKDIKLSDVYVWADKSKIMIFDTKENIYSVKKIRVWDKKRNNLIEKECENGVTVLNYNFPKESYLVDILIDDVWIENIPVEVK
ncbi:MAG: hypothetical protein SO179_07360 [Bacteroidales bacterium]|nr:hypothetical protein [Bacteroidales bacterium]